MSDTLFIGAMSASAFAKVANIDLDPTPEPGF